MIKLSKASSPQKRFDYDYVTLYTHLDKNFLVFNGTFYVNPGTYYKRMGLKHKVVILTLIFYYLLTFSDVFTFRFYRNIDIL